MEIQRKKRGAVRAQVTRIVKEIDQCLVDSAEPAVDALKAMLQRLETASSKLTEADGAMEQYITDDDADQEFEQVLGYSDKIAESLGRLKHWIETTGMPHQMQSASTSSNGPQPQRTSAPKIKLPKLELIRFDGKRRNWQPFWEQFEQSVHKNSDLTPSDRFNYLKSLLTGDAAAAIAGLPATAQCYNDAVDLLQQRFGGPAGLIQDHMQGLIDAQPVTSSRNVPALRRLYDSLQVHMRGLKALGVTDDSYSAMLYPVLLRVLPADMILHYHRRQAEENDGSGVAASSNGDSSSTGSSASSQGAPLRSLLHFYRRELESRERASESRPDDSHGKPPSHFGKRHAASNRGPPHIPTAAALHGMSSDTECLFCKSKAHDTLNCKAKMDLREKKAILTSKGRCFRCTKRGHLAKGCRAVIECKACKRRHATTMCDPEFSRKMHAHGEETKVKEAFNAPLSLHASENETHRPSVLMPTVTAWSKGESTKNLTRILFDSGSQRSFITEELSQRLGCRLLGTEKLSIGVFGGQRDARTFRRVEVRLISRHGANTERVIEALETPSICEQTIPCPNNEIRESLKELRCPLGDDPTDLTNMSTGVLVGSDYYWECITGCVRRLQNKLMAVETRFGWAVQGQTSSACQQVNCAHAVVLRTTVADRETAPILRQFWELEGVGVSEEMPKSSNCQVDDDFRNNLATVNGRYEVKLPWKDEVELSDNRAVAEKRFRSLTKRLSRSPELMEKYDAEMRRLIADGVAEEAPSEPLDGNQRIYYMPHQPVLRDSSTTTKLRIVFDASSHSTNANSLNDNLDSGPNLNPDLVRLLLNFRSHAVALVADAEKAFLQISVAPEDRDALRFLWFTCKPENGKPLPQITAFRMTRIPFGTTSSPFLLAATLQCHLEKMEEDYPETAKMLKNCIYVDDVLCGASSEDEAVKTYSEVNRIFAAASMRLHKWGSNSSRMRELFLLDGPNEVPLGQPANLLKVLGLTWLPNEDMLTFAPDSVIEFSTDQRNTKRFVLQTSARLYDPLGFLSTFTVRVKALFQEIWKANISWDQPLPDHLLEEWIRWCQELPLLSEMRIPRTYGGNIGGHPVHRTLHVFSDASQKAYGAVVYLCTESSTGERTCTLVMSKCRVAPVKPITLARLELMGALIASRLCQFVCSSLEVDIDSVHLWTDSMITLHWIQGDATRWKEFVKNRVAEIQQNTDVSRWRHCPGKSNPADLMTRGMTAASLKSSDMWWHGPSWIRQEEQVWPSEEHSTSFTTEELETKKEVNAMTTTCKEQPDLLELTHFSSATRVNRVTGWVMRFLHNLRSKEKSSGPLTAAEIERAGEYWLKQAQQTAFSEEIHRTTQGIKLSNDSSLKDFTLFVDEKGLLRIRGRLCSANKTPDERHPIVLPKEHRYATLLVSQAHLQLLHAGARDTLVQLRERYWIVRGRQLVKSVVRSCVVCRRYSASHIEADTGLLPPDRTSQAEPFEVVGIDFAGPLFVKERDETVKVYIALFTCAVTRAVHLELVTDMSTGTFIHAFRRFVSRRGLCRVVYSDNALTFKRASRDMGNLWKALRHPDSQSYFSNSGIEWKFIVERAPWWGGFYERMVRSVKLALKKTIGRQSLGVVELSTVLAEVEAVINSRPLTYTYDDPNDGAPLTPASFLAGRRLTTLPLHEERSFESTATSLRVLWQKRKQMLHLFWSVWRKEYLGELRSAYASKQAKGGVPGIGDVVLVREDRPRLLWKTGVVTAVFPGRDGKIRSCEVRLPQGKTLKRPVQFLFPLEIT